MDFGLELSNPRLLHAIAAQFPFVLAVVGAPLIYACAWTRGEKRALTISATLLYAALAGISAGAASLGAWMPEDAAGVDWYRGIEAMAWPVAAVAALLCCLSLPKLAWLRESALALAALTSIVVLVWTGMGAVSYGKLICLDGLGAGMDVKESASLVIPIGGEDMSTSEPDTIAGEPVENPQAEDSTGEESSPDQGQLEAPSE